MQPNFTQNEHTKKLQEQIEQTICLNQGQKNYFQHYQAFLNPLMNTINISPYMNHNCFYQYPTMDFRPTGGVLTCWNSENLNALRTYNNMSDSSPLNYFFLSGQSYHNPMPTIQLSENLSQVQKHQGQKQAIQRQNQIQQIQSYLQFDRVPVKEKMPQRQEKIKRQQNSQNQEDKQKPQEPVNIKKQIQNIPKKLSLFHNFQKHLVTLLKSKIRLSQRQMSRRTQGKLVSELWQYFRYTTRVSKRFLKCLLGHVQVQQQSNKFKYYEEYYHLIEHFNEYSQEDIKIAQKCLCREIVKQGRRILSQNLIEDGRMQNREEFKEYFTQFLNEVESGKVSKRLPKDKKLIVVNISAQNQQNH